MTELKTSADIAVLSDRDKDIVFGFDTARGHLKAGLARVSLMACMIIAGSLLSRHSTPMIDGMAWMRSSVEWIGYLAISLGILGIPLFSRTLRRDYQAMQATKRYLFERGFDVSRLSSDEVWTGLFSPQKAG